MGSPDFAVPSLSAMLEVGFEVPLVVTQPDRPVGRGSEPRPTAVAALAAARGLALEKPERLRDNAAFLARLEAARPNAIAVVAYGRILPNAILELPRLGCVNVHASLLPRFRGASPIQAAVLNGDAETGVVTMRIVEALDAGPLYLRRAVAIGPRETAGELSGRLAGVGAELLVETLRGLAAGALPARPQEGEPSFCPPIRREDGLVDWSFPAPAIARRLRAFTPVARAVHVRRRPSGSRSSTRKRPGRARRETPARSRSSTGNSWWPRAQAPRSRFDGPNARDAAR